METATESLYKPLIIPSRYCFQSNKFVYDEYDEEIYRNEISYNLLKNNTIILNLVSFFEFAMMNRKEDISIVLDMAYSHIEENKDVFHSYALIINNIKMLFGILQSTSFQDKEVKELIEYELNYIRGNMRKGIEEWT